MWLVPVLWYEMSVKNTSPKYISNCDIWSWHSHGNVSDKCFCTDNSRSIIYPPRQANTHPILPAFRKYFPILQLPEMKSNQHCVLSRGVRSLITSRPYCTMTCVYPISTDILQYYPNQHHHFCRAVFLTLFSRGGKYNSLYTEKTLSTKTGGKI